MMCISCNSTHTIKNGKKYNGKQNYKCFDCGRQFIKHDASYRMRHSIKEIVLALMLKFQRQSLREIAKFWFTEVFKRSLSHTSVYNWCMKFSGKFETLLYSVILDISNVWHVDEKFIHVKGSKDKHAYLWKVIDSNNNILAVHVSNLRDVNNAKKVLQEALKLARKPPDILVSDGLHAYGRAKKILGRKCKHIVAHFEGQFVMKDRKLYFVSNNRIERSNSTTNLWLHVFRGFKSFKTANIWCKMYQVFFNFLRACLKLDYKRPAEVYSQDYKYVNWQQALAIC